MKLLRKTGHSSDQIQQIADLTFKQWPDKEEAKEAALTLVTFAAASHQIDQALEYLNKISVQSPRRGQAELRAGQALWAAYLRGTVSPKPNGLSNRNSINGRSSQKKF